MGKHLDFNGRLAPQKMLSRHSRMQLSGNPDPPKFYDHSATAQPHFEIIVSIDIICRSFTL